MKKTIAIEFLKQKAFAHGLKYMGSTDLTSLVASEKHLKEWQANGYAAEMDYMLRPAERLANPALLFAEAKSAIVFAVHYDRTEQSPCPSGWGRVARYAWGEDYHYVLPRRIRAMLRSMQQELGFEPNAQIFTDSAPLLERAFAERAGCGFVGKNSMLISPGEGSFFFLAELLWDVEVQGALQSVKGSCGSCSRCIQKCPTQALQSDYTLNAGRCISYLSIEKSGILNKWERAALGSWIFGCDICQEVCPFNHASLKEKHEPDLNEFDRSSGVGPRIELASLLLIRSAHQFRKRFRKSALMRAGREKMLRNALVVAANTGAYFLTPHIIECLAQDRSEIVRSHALYALDAFKAEIDRGKLQRCFDLAYRDPAALVRSTLQEIGND